MDIIFYHPTFDTGWWINALAKAVPSASVRKWKADDSAYADYALVWHPPIEILAGRRLKAVFALGAGVDSILSKLNAHPEMLDTSASLSRLENTGIGLQMQEYAVSQVLYQFHRFDDYQALENQAKRQPLPEYTRDGSTIGIMGVGVLGAKIAESLQSWRSPLRCWSRTHKSWPGVESFAGTEELSAFLSQTRVLINLLPNTVETMGIISAGLLSQLQGGAYALNLARGVHLKEDDLLVSLEGGKVGGAMLNVYSREPLPGTSPLWKHPRVAMTPYIAAVTRPAEMMDYTSRMILSLESGKAVTGQVDHVRRYQC